MARQNVKATLVIYANIPGIGWRRGSLIQAKNGRVKPGCLLYNDTEYSCPNSVFQIRTYKGNQAVYTTIGDDLEKAQAALAQLIDQRQLEQLEVKLGITAPRPKEGPKTLKTLREGFIEKYAHGSADTEYAYRYISGELLRLLEARGKRYAADITEDDVIAFDRHLEALGNKKNTRATRYGYVRCFLSFCGLDPAKVISAPEHKKLKAKPKLAVQKYSEHELERLYAASSERNRLTWRTFCELGLRDEELAFAFWTDVDLDNGVWHVRFKTAGSFPWDSKLTWNSKDSEERDLPIPAGLLKELRGLYKYADRKCPLVFPTRNGRPNIKLLKALKADWRRAGLNCGHCSGCTRTATKRVKGRRVTYKPNECTRAKLKTFRSTYLSTMLKFTHLRNVQALAGHSDIATTQRYLAVDNDVVLKQAANAAFAV